MPLKTGDAGGDEAQGMWITRSQSPLCDYELLDHKFLCVIMNYKSPLGDYTILSRSVALMIKSKTTMVFLKVVYENLERSRCMPNSKHVTFDSYQFLFGNNKPYM